jgi:hypothetical protein
MTEKKRRKKIDWTEKKGKMNCPKRKKEKGE